MNWIGQLLKLTSLNLMSLLGSLIGFGVLFNVLEQWNTRFIFNAFGKWGIILTGFIGTVIHEGSHALMCLVFGHRIREIKWFRPVAGQSDGVLGYVSHTYDKGNWYQTAGNFFIGIAPIIGGTLVMILLLRLLLPTTYAQIKQSIPFELYARLGSEMKIGAIVTQGMKDLSYILKELIFNKSIFSWQYGLFLFSTYSIATHMGLSWADLKGSFSGLLIIFLGVLILTVVGSLTGITLARFSKGIVIYNVFVSLFLSVGMVFSVLTLLISFLFSRIF